MIVKSSTERHWDKAYADRDSTNLSWYQPKPDLSLRLLTIAGLDRGAAVLDVGGGASQLVDQLLARGYRVGVLDIAEVALAKSRERLGDRADVVEWFHIDVRSLASPHQWDAWHDRALFHFLVDSADRAAYRDALLRALRPAGVVVLATFGPDGPERCSGLPTVRYEPDGLARELGPSFHLVEAVPETHRTPQGKVQEFIYCLFCRTAP